MRGGEWVGLQENRLETLAALGTPTLLGRTSLFEVKRFPFLVFQPQAGGNRPGFTASYNLLLHARKREDLHEAVGQKGFLGV